jgi:hypothetical protein
VPKEYLAWCDAPTKSPLVELEGGQNKFPTPSRLLSWMIRNKDSFFMTGAGRKEYKNLPGDPVVPITSDARTDFIRIPNHMVIPRGRILCFGPAYHVALSTGTRVALKTEAARAHCQVDYGHGILELDSYTGTVRESALEDFLESRPLYLQQFLTVSPFPVIPKNGSVKLVLPSKSPAKGDNAKQKTKRGEIRNKLVIPIKKTRARLLEEKEAAQKTHLYKKKKLQDERETASAQRQLEIDEQIAQCNQEVANIESEWKKNDKIEEVKELDAAAEADRQFQEWRDQEAGNTKIQEFKYSATNPYQGDVPFPYQID